MTTAIDPASPVVRKLEQQRARYNELQAMLNDSSINSDHVKVIAISRELGGLETVVSLYQNLLDSQKQIAELSDLATSSDADMANMAAEELPQQQRRAAELFERIKDELVTAEEKAVASFFLEVRAGTGGEEAALFVRDLFEAYQKFTAKHGWKFDVNDFSDAERGGLKEVIINIKGAGAFQHFQYEGGGHRVQRVPETETQGRIHTSAATVAVLPELPDVKVDVAPKDVEEYGCRGGGPGGQNVNKVETGWYIKHKPTGIRFKMTEHKSQTQNKERAWALLRATLHSAEVEKQHAAQMGARKAMMGSGDRSQRVRTYNFPQNRCTDHRLGGEGGGEKNFNLDQIMLGNLEPLIGALIELDKQQRVEAL